jgi:dihydrofolate reductase
MRKVILNLAVSLDGFIEDPNGEFDWCFTDQDYGMKAFFSRIDTIFMGRKSYELVKSMVDDLYKDKKIYVFSRTLKEVAPGEELITANLEEQVKQIKHSAGKDIWLFGGASLISSFINSQLIDEFMLAVHPLILGGGKPLFTDIKHRTLLKLQDARTYSSGLVQLFYTI